MKSIYTKFLFITAIKKEKPLVYYILTVFFVINMLRVTSIALFFNDIFLLYLSRILSITLAPHLKYLKERIFNFVKPDSPYYIISSPDIP